MKSLLKVIIFLGLNSAITVGFSQAITSNGTGGGNWSNGASWIPNTPGGPNSGNSTSILIAAGDVINADVNVSIDQTTIQATATLNINGGVTLTVADGTGTDLQNNGTLAIATGGGFPPGPAGILNVNGQVAHAGAAFTGTAGTQLFINAGATYDHQVSTNQALPLATWNSTSTCEVSGSNGNTKPNNLNQAFGNFVWNFPVNGYTGGIDLNGDLSNIAGNFTISSTGSAFNYLGLSAITNKTIIVGGDLVWAASTYGYITSTATVTVNVGNNFSCSSGQFFMNNTGNATIDVANDFLVPSGGSFDFTFSSGGVNVNVAGDLDIGSGTVLKSGAGSATLTIDGTTDQSLLSSVNNLIAFNTQISNTSLASFNFGSNSYQTGGNYSVSNLATLDLGSGYLAGSGSLTLDAGSTMRVGSTDVSGAMQTGTSGGNIRISGSRTYTAGANIIYSGSGAQVIGNGFPASAVNLEIDNAAGVTNSAGASNIIGDLLLTNGSFNIGASSSMSIQSNYSRTLGTIGGSSSSNLTFSGSGVSLDPLVMTTGALTLNNLTISGSENLDLGSDLSVLGVLDNDNTLDFSNQTLTLNGTLTGFGDFVANSSSELVIGGSGAFGTIGFNGSGNQLNNLTINRTSGTVTWAANVTIVNGLYLTKGTLVHSSGLTMAATTGTVFKGQGTISTNEPIAASGYDLVYNASGNTSLESVSTTKINDVTVSSGTISLQNNLTINGDFDLDNGTFTAGSNNVSLAGSGVSFLANGGSFSQSSSNSLIISGTVSLGGSSIDGTQIGNLEITGTLTAPSANVFVSGDFDNDGTFNAGSGTVTFNGAASSIQGTSITTFHNLAISAAGDLTASSGTSNVSGSYTNAGTFDNNSGTIVMTSSSTESITCGGDAFNDLTFSGSGTVTLSDALDVNGDLTLSSGSSLDVTTNDRDINIAGNWTNNGGTFNERLGVVIFDGTIMNIAGSSPTTFNDINITNGTTRVTGTADLEGTLTLSASTTLDADGPSNTGVFTVKSTSGNDARIAALGSGAVINGNMTFERYLPSYGSNRWRNIGSAVGSAQVSDIQNEILISGDFIGNNNIALGLTDPLGPNSIQSMAGYNEALGSGVDNDWVNFPAANNSETFTVGQGYSIYVRETGAVTFDLRGTVNQGSISLPVTGTGDLWNLVSNPYASSIDWDNGSGWTRSNIQGDAIAVWNGLQYLTWNGSTGSLGNGRIPMGMAFWVQASNSSISLNINENSKTSTTGTVHREINPTALELSLTSIEYPYTDKAHIEFMEGAEMSFDNNDLGKLPNSIFNLATTSSDDIDLSINAISNFVCGEEIPISLTNLWVDTYRLNWSNIDSIDPNIYITLIDKLSGEEYDLRSFGEAITLTVTTDSDVYDTLGTESNPYYTYQIKDRFSLAFREAGFSTELMANAVQVCEEVTPMASLIIEQAEEGVDYDVYKNGVLVVSGFGVGADLAVSIGSEYLNEGENEFTIKASRGGCAVTEFSSPIFVNIIDNPNIAYNDELNTLSTSAIGSIQWYKNDEPLEGETGNSLSLDIYETSTTANYYVSISNDDCERLSEVYIILGVEDGLEDTGIEVYPNPTKDKFYISLDNNSFGSVLLRIHSSNGLLIDERVIDSGETEIDASSYENGLYLIELIDNNRRFSKRVVKQ